MGPMRIRALRDPLDSGRTFTWLICEGKKNKGNDMVYRYKAEDGAGVVLSKTSLSGIVDPRATFVERRTA
jgi:hypothetical protein